MEKEIINPINGYFINLMHEGFGWIQLKNGSKDAGYIYFKDDLQADKDRFGAENSDHPYVVTHMPKAMWQTILQVLKTEKNLFIRGFDSGNGDVTAFLFTSSDGTFSDKRIQ